MDASWMYVANYFREISEAHGSIEMEKVRNEALRLVGISRRAARGARWDAVFVGVCLRLSGYSCPQSPDADAYRGFGRPLGDQPGRGSVVVLADDAFSGGTTRVGFLEEADGDSVKVIEAVEDLNIVISTYDRARILDYRWPIEATGLPHGTSLPTIASISPENTPLSVKFAMGTVEPLRMAEAPDFAYWDRTGETLHGVEGHEAAAPAPAVIESVVIGPVLRREEGRAPRLVEIARAAEPPRIRSTVR
ncbi:MAG: hypothetical protein HY371_19675, partial [Devosia nanyangense]|nr:hypothetical protein [Devosia nanyangense]